MQGCWHDNKLEYVVRLRQMLTQFYIIIYIIFSFIVFWNIHKWEGLGVKERGGGTVRGFTLMADYFITILLCQMNLNLHILFVDNNEKLLEIFLKL